MHVQRVCVFFKLCHQAAHRLRSWAMRSREAARQLLSMTRSIFLTGSRANPASNRDGHLFIFCFRRRVEREPSNSPNNRRDIAKPELLVTEWQKDSTLRRFQNSCVGGNLVIVLRVILTACVAVTRLCEGLTPNEMVYSLAIDERSVFYHVAQMEG